MTRYLPFMLVPFIISTIAEAQQSPGDGQLTCELERQVLFGANSDYPNGPAYYGVRKDRENQPNGGDENYDPEVEIQNTVDNFVTRAHGAKFTLDAKTGVITPIPFGNERILAIEQLPGNHNYSRILSPGFEYDQNANYSVGYFDRNFNNLTGILLLDAQQGGARIFKYVSFGEALFGYCYAGD